MYAAVFGALEALDALGLCFCCDGVRHLDHLSL
jgi:hypothetical protein